MPRIELLPWEKARAHASPIRFSVFVEEQGVPREIELDEHDPVCVHAVVFEDALSGVRAGRAGGFALVVGVDRGGAGEALLRSGADIACSDLRRLWPGA